ncbi:MAG TPA: sugar phosphate nucleotidyltransferase [Gaiellaceae bacterium]|nr:sugar phosphate nucleotidyltransferase [Gaiellaceae bacterium]
MKAIVMAGGEGTRLRPLTSNQPKPMVPIVGKPCMEHIVELLRRHGLEDVIVTLAFLPQAIESYFGDGEALGVSIDYSLEATPMGTAGSVKLAARKIDEPFLVISGDALTDFDLTRLVRFHTEREAAVTIALKAVDNPLDFGIVVTADDGRIERFLEKPSWGQVFSDTINTGIYVLDPSVLRHVPDDTPFDFSKELFPRLLELGRPLYGHICDGYWQDIGNLDQYRQANVDALDRQIDLDIPGIRLRGNIWIGEGVEIEDLEGVEGPAFIGNYCAVSPEATIGPHTVLGANVRLRERARVVRSIVDQSTFVGRSASVEGAIVGKSCDLRSHVHVHDGAALGDGVTLGAQAVVMPDVRIFPHKEVEAGAIVHESLVWEAAGATHLFGAEGVAGVVNVDLTPEMAVRLAAALGTVLQRSARVVASRDATAACRMIKRAMVSGLTSTGISIADLRVLPAPVNRHLIRTQGYAAGFHVGTSPTDPEHLVIRFFEHPGTQLTPRLEKEVEKHFTRYELRRASPDRIGRIGYPVRVRESYASDLLATLDASAIARRRFRVVVDYGRSAASFVLPLVLGPLEVEAISAHEFAELDGLTLPPEDAIGQATRLVEAVGADLGAVFDLAGERLFFVDEQAQEVAAGKALLLFVRLLKRDGEGGRVALPVTATKHAETVAAESGLEVVRTSTSPAELMQAARGSGMVFAAGGDGAYVIPDFQPAYDAMASLCKLLELLALADAPVSELVAGLPDVHISHRTVACSSAMKGLVMRVLTERLANRDVDLRDGIKVFDDGGWTLVRPDPVDPLLHVTSEGGTQAAAENSLEHELLGLVQDALTEERISS